MDKMTIFTLLLTTTFSFVFECIKNTLFVVIFDLLLLLIFSAGHCLHNENKTNPEDIKVGFGRLSANISTNETGSILSSVSGKPLFDDIITKLCVLSSRDQQ